MAIPPFICLKIKAIKEIIKINIKKSTKAKAQWIFLMIEKCQFILTP